MAVVWAGNEVGGKIGINSTINCHRELRGGNRGHHQIPQYLKWGWDLMMVI